jgi:RNA polymerase sigma factor (sigma-70 family)
MNDQELLDSFRAQGSPEAFAELVRRYSDLVYSVALRALNDPHTAEDATQAAFVVLWRKGRSLKPGVSLAGWLFKTARTTALYLRRSGRSRIRREQEKAAMVPKTNDESLWESLRPHVDAALESLPAAERETVLLRYLHGRSHAEIAQGLRCPEATVRTRLTAGLERLRKRLQLQGIAVPTVTALGVLLSQRATEAAPTALSAAIQASCAASAAAASLEIHALAEGVMKTLFWAKVKLVTAVFSIAALAGVSGASVIHLARGDESAFVRPAPLAGSVSLKAISGAENGTEGIVAQWKAKILEKRGGKFQSHDWWWWGLSVIDYDADGDLDLVANVHGPAHGLILKNQWIESGRVAFVNATPELGAEFLIPGTNWNPLVWDANGDGWLDIWGTGHDQPILCLYNEGGKKFVEAPFKSILYNNPRVEDVTGDGWPDVWHVRGGQREEMISENGGKGFKHRRAPDEAPAGIPEAIRTEIKDLLQQHPRNFAPNFRGNFDLNGDGHKDLVLHSFGGYGVGPAMGRYLVADGTGKFADRTAEIGLPTTGTPILIQDLTGDGAPEVLVAGDANGGVYVNDGKGRFKLAAGPLTTRLKERLPYLHRAYPVDLRNSGRMDLVLSTRRGETQHVFENVGNGDFREVAKSGAWIDGIAIGDMNNDGLLDVCVGMKEQLVVYLNQTAEPGNYCDVLPRMDPPNRFAAGAVVEAFNAGEMGKPGSVPFVAEKAHADGTPVHLGLGTASRFDLRVTFPGKDPKVLTLKGVEARKRLQITPDGMVEASK